MIRGSRTPSCLCRRVKTEKRMVQANGWRESSLQLFRVLQHGEKRRCRCREPSPGKEKLRWQESSAVVLPRRFFNFTFEVRRPGEGYQEPHQQRRGKRKHSL